MQALSTRYLGPTDHRGARVKVSAERGSVVVPWDDALDTAANHCRAALRALERWEWSGRWVGGSSTSNPRGFIFVCVPGTRGAASVDPL